MSGRLEGRRLYLCTGDREELGDFVSACIAGGVDVVQLREKNLEARPLIERAKLLRRLCSERDVPFIMNDRPDLALFVGADGVHVGQDDAPVALCRSILGADRIVGLSTHQPSELDAASADAVDYISAGPVVETPTKPGRAGTGTSYVAAATAVAAAWPGGPLPLFVTGGVTPESVGDYAAAGARRFVVVRYLTESDDPEAAARRLRRAIDEAISIPKTNGGRP